MGERADFLTAFLRAPFSTGAIAPSSCALAPQMIAGVDLARARTVVEVGPGTGAFTGAILQACGEDTLVMAVELNGDFAAWRSAPRGCVWCTIRLKTCRDGWSRGPGIRRRRLVRCSVGDPRRRRAAPSVPRHLQQPEGRWELRHLRLRPLCTVSGRSSTAKTAGLAGPSAGW